MVQAGAARLAAQRSEKMWAASKEGNIRRATADGDRRRIDRRSTDKDETLTLAAMRVSILSCTL